MKIEPWNKMPTEMHKKSSDTVQNYLPSTLSLTVLVHTRKGTMYTYFSLTKIWKSKKMSFFVFPMGQSLNITPIVITYSIWIEEKSNSFLKILHFHDGNLCIIETWEDWNVLVMLFYVWRDTMGKITIFCLQKNGAIFVSKKRCCAVSPKVLQCFWPQSKIFVH